MKKAVPDSSNSFFPPQNACLIYRPKSTNRNEEVFYTQEASRILSRSLQSLGIKKLSFAGLYSLCIRWKRLLDKSPAEEEGNTSAHILDTLKSDRRLYAIKGLRLSNHQPAREGIENQFIFILERMQADKMNLSLIGRHFALNKRELDIVRLLIEERGNKDIAEVLGLSLNTIKSYLRILMRKLGVSSRAGIITCLLTKK
jgi:DNA-binding CsgD family transcriptional regulator